MSGGEKTLVHFAKILLDSPDLLLLDEPTNHLDIERIEWLESYLQRFKGAVVIVSHDRYFLDKAVNKIIDSMKQFACIHSSFPQNSLFKKDKKRKMKRGEYYIFIKNIKNLKL